MLKEYFDEVKYEELKNSDNLVYKALEIVNVLFENDVDKGGYPYMEHLLKVYKNVDSIDAKVVALLHDIIEDKNIKEDELLDIGFPSSIVSDVKVLSRDKSLEYQTYIDNIVKNGTVNALKVKLADLKHNMDLSRFKVPTPEDIERVNKKYRPAYEKIITRLEEMEK